MKLSKKDLQKIDRGSEPSQILLSLLKSDPNQEYIKNLSHLCENGGYPDDQKYPQYKILNSSKTKHYYTITFEVLFDEKTHGQGCSVVPDYKPRYGEIDIKLMFETGELVWP